MAIKDTLADRLQALHAALLTLSPAQFEAVSLCALGQISGQTLRQANSGRQPTGDGSGLSISLEAKRYHTGAPPARSLIGGLAMAAQDMAHLTHWVLATTIALPAQTAQDLRVQGDSLQVKTVLLDWPEASSTPPLAAILVLACSTICQHFPALEAPLGAVANEPSLTALGQTLAQELRAPFPQRDPFERPLTYRPGLGLTTLLDARYRVVPLMNRDDDLAQWQGWAQSGQSKIRLLTGDGGMGKTRFVMELCLRLQQQGWHAGLLKVNAPQTHQAILSQLLKAQRPCLLAIDYADKRAKDLDALSQVFVEQGPVPLILISRNAGSWLNNLKTSSAAVAALLEGSLSEAAHRLSPSAPQHQTQRQVSRLGFLQRATEAFLDHAGSQAMASREEIFSRLNELDLSGADYNRALLLLAEGWTAAFSRSGQTDSAWDKVLAREERYIAQQAVLIEPADILPVLAWITAHDGAETAIEAMKLLKSCPQMTAYDDAAVASFARFLHAFYPGPQWLNPLQPDALAAALMNRHLR